MESEAPSCVPPTVIFFGLALASAMISFTDLYFELAFTISMYSSKAKLAIGVKSLSPTGVMPISGVVRKVG